MYTLFVVSEPVCMGFVHCGKCGFSFDVHYTNSIVVGPCESGMR